MARTSERFTSEFAVTSTQVYLKPADCWFLTGPTASGKTDVAMELARQLDAEIVSLDSMALYRGMDIGTAKASAVQRAAVRHHLIDVIDPHEEYSVAQYVAATEDVVRDICSRQRKPLFVGGTPLYLKALLRGIFAGPAADWSFRHRMHELADREGDLTLHRRLAAVDPVTAKRLHANDRRRVIRALEVYEQTGQSITDLQRQFDRARLAEACRVFMLAWPRQQLVDRIDARVDVMFAAGLIEEVRQLLASPTPPGRTARQAVGYREVIEHLEGQRDLDATIDLTKRRTRQFAKRQLTWFRSLSEVRAVSAGDPPERTAARILASIE